jgi:YesN/AraC family two-component response regulator
MQTDIILENKKLKDLNPLIFGFQHCNKNHKYGPATRDYYLIHFIVSGCGTLEINNCKYKINKNQAFLIKPSQITTYKADSNDPWHYIWIGFNGILADKFNEFSSPVIDMNLNVFFEMLEVSQIQNTKEEFLASKLFSMYVTIFDNEKNENYVKKVKNYIKSNYMNIILVEDIAKMVGLDRRYLSRIFKNDTNLSVKEYLTKTRLEKASFFLEKGHRVSEVSKLVGYDDPLAFSKIFKKHTGVSPTKV